MHFIALKWNTTSWYRSHWNKKTHLDTISYPLFADADTGIYPHAAPRYHARPKAKRGIAVLSVDKFPYPRKQTGGNEFIPCSNVWNLFKVSKSCFEVKPIRIAQRNIYEELPATGIVKSHGGALLLWRQRWCRVHQHDMMTHSFGSLQGLKHTERQRKASTFNSNQVFKRQASRKISTILQTICNRS